MGTSAKEKKEENKENEKDDYEKDNKESKNSSSDENSEKKEDKNSSKSGSKESKSSKDSKDSKDKNSSNSGSSKEKKEKSSKRKSSDSSKEDKKEEEKEEKKSQKSSDSSNSVEVEKKDKKSKKSKKETEKKVEYKDVLPHEIPEERKICVPNKLPFNYDCCQTIEKAHSKEITTLAYILRRNAIATGSVDEMIKLWIINTDKKKMSLDKELKGHKDSILCIKDFPKLNCFCSASSDCTLKLWNCTSLKCVNTLNFHTQCALSCCYNPKGNYEIFSGGQDSVIVVWGANKPKDLQSYESKFVLKGHKKLISSLAFADDYDYLISSSDDKTIRIWDMKISDNIRCIKIIEDLSSPVDYMVYLDNRLMAACEDGVISFIKMNKLKRSRSVKFSDSPVYCFTLFQKHKYMLLGNKDGKARVWKIGSNRRLVLKGHTQAVTGVTDFEEDFIVTSSIDCSIKLWKKD